MKSKFFYVIAILLVLIGISIGSAILAVNKLGQPHHQFYNVTYYNDNVTLEYHDVTNLYYDNIGVYFKTEDGRTVILNTGAIEIIPLDLD